MKIIVWRTGNISHIFLTPALDVGEWSLYYPRRKPQYALDRRLDGPHRQS
jgi:hypothetical protein